MAEQTAGEPKIPFIDMPHANPEIHHPTLSLKAEQSCCKSDRFSSELFPDSTGL
jgi:hypothetical protein